MNYGQMTLPQIRHAGMAALLEKLGLAATLRFLQQFDTGAGDYTAERQQWLGTITPEELSAALDRRQRGG